VPIERDVLLTSRNRSGAGQQSPASQNTAGKSAPPSNSSGNRKKEGVFYGWWIVLAGSISQAYTSGTFWQGFGAFFDPIIEQFGWSRALTAGAMSLQRMESGGVSPFVGWFIDKFGPRNVMLFGTFLTALGFVLLSRIQELWQFYAAFLILTLGLSFGTFLIVTTAVANWFVENRSKALSFTMAGSGLGGVLVPAVIWLIATTDWRTGLVVVGIGCLAVGIPVSFVMKSRPEDYGMLPDGAPLTEDGSTQTQANDSTPRRSALSGEVTLTTREALKSRVFWQLAIAMGVSGMVISASIHQIPAITSFGISRNIAGFAILGVSLFSVAGRLGSGFFGDRLDKRRVIAGALLLQFIGTIVFAFSSEIWHLVIFVILWGFGFGASIPVRFALIADLFGRRHYGSIMGTLMTTSAIFGVIAPVLVGWIFDLRGNYREPFALMAFSVLIAIPMILTLGSGRARG
jgi:sugar phosphate permease